MSTRIFARRASQIRTGTGADKVLFGMSFPTGTVIHDMKAQVQMVGTTEQLARNVACWYGFSGYLIPVVDPDAAVGFETLWDSFVPKDVLPGNGSLDLDTQTADSTPFFEPGLPDFASMFDVGLQPERVYHRDRLLTVLSAAHVFQDAETPFNIVWMAGDKFMARVKKSYRLTQPMSLIYSVAVPATTATTTVVEAALAENEWSRLRYIDEVLSNSMRQQLGLVEAGAETPWEEATLLLRKVVEPDVHEANANSFVTEGFDVYGELLVDFSVEGSMQKLVISGGR